MTKNYATPAFTSPGAMPQLRSTPRTREHSNGERTRHVAVAMSTWRGRIWHARAVFAYTRSVTTNGMLMPDNENNAPPACPVIYAMACGSSNRAE